MSINKILIVDHEKCTGCAYCMLACSMEHEDPVQRSKSRMKVCKLERKAIGAPAGDISTLRNPKAARARRPHPWAYLALLVVLDMGADNTHRMNSLPLRASEKMRSGRQHYYIALQIFRTHSSDDQKSS